MDRAAILKTLNDWRDAMVACDQQTEIVAHTFAASPDSPLLSAIYELQGKYTRAVAIQLQWCDETLNDWWLMHRFGEEKPMQAALPNEPMRTLESNADLAQFIHDDHMRASKR